VIQEGARARAGLATRSRGTSGPDAHATGPNPGALPSQNGSARSVEPRDPRCPSLLTDSETRDVPERSEEQHVEARRGPPLEGSRVVNLLSIGTPRGESPTAPIRDFYVGMGAESMHAIAIMFALEGGSEGRVFLSLDATGLLHLESQIRKARAGMLAAEKLKVPPLFAPRQP
jgi:hypothetical protein